MSGSHISVAQWKSSRVSSPLDPRRSHPNATHLARQPQLAGYPGHLELAGLQRFHFMASCWINVCRQGAAC